ncbi:uncharacterized protein LOC131662676 [Vicia villosa]|uniref:uncharacterized protein LOC131662676 n=1 Tax=Vicia villosa TaxID=3911 RepID=UPI00273CB943|nr:uncharacterized protein LOC131662676 [Vicia villosa]
MVTQDARKLRQQQQKKGRGAAAGDQSGSAGSPRVLVEGERSPKRPRPSEMSREEGSTRRSDRTFVLPPCFKDGGYFDRVPMATSPDEARRVDSMDSPALLKHLASDGAAVMRVLEMTQVLASRSSISPEELRKAESEKKKAVEDANRLKADREKLKKKVDEALKQKDEEIEAEKKKVADLQREWAPSDEEFPDVAVLKSRAEFVEKINEMKLSLAEMAEAGFDYAVRQLRVLNPGLKEGNIGVSSRIVDGAMVPESPGDDE